ncbi:hormone-sensitive lipase [Kalaharituber pfeilii]|nr:hormone-sensitive lipase [Kalaharituber pfeilii]
MIDHVLGRPSSRFRKIQVFLVLSFWTTYLLRGNTHGPPLIRRLSARLTSKLTAWQTVTLTMLYLYFARNFAKIMGLECPEPLANLYSRSYFRATWVMTALDAGFWTAMTIRRKWIRDISSILFTIYYLFAAEQADEKVRRVRATVTVEHLRVSWEKSQTPYLRFLTSIMHPFRTRYAPRHLRIQRPRESEYKEPVDVWLYFEGSREDLKSHKKIVLDIPGGGFVAMGPRNHDDKLMGWSRKLKIPVISVQYRKAPEYPYPNGLHDCYDVYHSIIATNGKCIGLSGEVCPRIALSGDSAGGNLAAGVTLMILNSSNDDLDHRHRENIDIKSIPPPEGLVLIYPSLDMNIGSWMTDDQVKLIQERSTKKTNRSVVRRKSDYYAQASGLKPIRQINTFSENYDSSDSEPEDIPTTMSPTKDVQHFAVTAPTRNTPSLPHQPHTSTSIDTATSALQATKPQPLSTRLAMTSRLTYFNDRILTPEMMRAMVILYIGPCNQPDFATDFYLSPIVAPETLLRRFPKTYFLTGERDPLVDDTVIFAGKIRQAKIRWARECAELGLHNLDFGPDALANSIIDTIPEVRLIPAISHGFLLMAGVFPQAKREIVRCARWLEDILADKPESAMAAVAAAENEQRPRHHYRTDTGTTSVGMESTDEEGDKPLEMAMSTPGSSATATAARPRRGGPRRGGLKQRGLKGSNALGSEEDLVGRRMKGLMGGLTGLEDQEELVGE